MSFLPINEQNQQAPQGQTTNAPVGNTGNPPPQQSGGSVGGGTTGGTKGGPNSGSPAQFGSSASKLGDYLSANAPQVTQEANNLAGNLNNQYAGLNTEINNGANAFNQQVQGGYAAANPDLINQAMANPTQFASTPSNVSGFQAQYNDQYTGPQNFESTTPYSQIQGDVSNAVSQAGLLNNQQGLQTYLQGVNPNATQAASTLDALLLNGNPQAQQTVQNAAGQFGNLTGNLQNAVTTGDAGVTAAQQAATAAQQQAQGTFNPYVQNFGNTLNTNAANAEAGRTAYNNSVDQFQGQATPIEQQINQWLGMLPNNAGTGINDLFAPAIAKEQPITNPITAQNFSTPEQYAQAAAIQQLLGGTGQLPINQTTTGLAGTAPQISQTPPPSIQDLLQQYAGPLGRAYEKGLGGNGSGWGASQQNVENATIPLVQYLSQYDPTFQYNPATGAMTI